MFGLSRLLDLAGTITWRPTTRAGNRWPNSRRQPIRRGMLALEELEIRVVPSLLGQQLFPADYPWNQNISSAPVAANSAAIISHIGTSIKIHPDWGNDSGSNGSSPLYGIPFNVVHGNSAAKINVIIDNYPGESDIVAVPMPANPVIEGDFQNGPNPATGYGSGARGDSHLIVWDEDNNIAYEFFQTTRPTDPLLPNGQAHTDGKWHANQESVWNMKTDSFRSLGWTSADAAGLSILAGLARPDEGLTAVQGGQAAITHALRFTLPSGDVNPQYIYPASHVVKDSSGSTKLPFGARLRLMNTSAVNSIISTLGPEAQIIAHAMQQYGLVLADIGSAMYVTGSSGSVDANNNLSLTWDMNDVLTLNKLTAGDFEVLDLAPRVTGLSVNTGQAGSTITVVGQNFSGAAGHLSVFFGSTAASSVAYVDDSHLTVVVPGGTGTVHVTVQSGVNEVDPNNPSDNVNNPIFGYGTSATSSADQFTYGGPTVSAANSTASFASPTVSSGSTGLLTIVVKDGSGNAITGLTNSAFSFSLSGGASAGAFSTVTESATPGTYTSTFTATTAGTTSTLTVTVNGVTLNSKPQITVTGATSFSDNFSVAGPNRQLDSSWTTQLGSFLVNTSAHTATGTSGMNLATVNSISSADVTVADNVALQAGQSAALLTRYGGPGDRNYYLGQIQSISGGFQATIWRNVGGSFTLLATGKTVGSGAGTLEFESVGPSLKLIFNGQVVAFADDTTLTSTGLVGMRLGMNAAVSSFQANVLTLPSPTLPFTDTFSASSPAGPPSDGSQLSRAWIDQSGDVTVVNGQAAGQAGFNLSTVHGLSQGNVAVQASVSLTNGQWVGLVARCSGPLESNYYLGQLQSVSGGFQATIWKNINGSFTRLTTGNTVSSGTGTLEFEAVGPSLKLILNGQLLAFADDTNLSAGSVGIRLASNGAVSNFQATAVTVTNATLPFTDTFGSPSDGSQLSRSWTDQNGAVTIVNGQAVGQSGFNLSTLNGVNVANVTTQANIALSAGQWVGLVARYSGPLESNYYLAQLQSTANGFQATIWKNVGGVFTLLATGSTVSSATGTMSFSVEGSSLKLSLGGAQLASAVDTTLTSGSVGMRLGLNTAVSDFTAQ